MKLRLVPIFLWSLGSVAALAADAPFKLTGVKLFSDHYANKVESKNGGFSASFGVKVGNTDSPASEITNYEFSETQHVEFFTFQLSPASANKEVSMTVIAEKTTAGAEREIITVSGEVDKDGSLPARVSLKRDWPVGMYRIELSYQGKPVGQAGYRVKAAKDRTAPIQLKELTIYTMENNKGIVRPSPKPGDHYLEFHTETTGAKTSGATVLWKLIHLDEAGKIKDEVSTVETKEWPLENTALVHSVELPKDWPAGKYRCDYSVDGVPVGTKPFEIKP